MKNFKNIIVAVILIVAAFGLIGGVGYTLYYGDWLLSLVYIILGILAFPQAKTLFASLWCD